jgi:tripartite-type tricarboxylate transporter receptor subunit TctC
MEEAARIGLLFDTYSTLGPQFRAGTIRPLGISTAERPAFAPDRPTLAEAGLDDFVVSSWCVLLAPAGTPQGIVERLSAEIRRILREPAMTTKLQDLGFVVEGRPPAGTGEFLRFEVDSWRTVIRIANVAVE